MRVSIATSFTVSMLFIAPGVSAQPGQPTHTAGFNLHCAPPFGGAGKRTAIDNTCGIDGDPKASAAAAAQNAVKNNFCAVGPIVSLTQADMVSLQTAVDDLGISYGKLEGSRTPLKNIAVSDEGISLSEGEYVQFVGFITGAHYSDREIGESVNCHKSHADNNDIHVPIVQNPNDGECQSITVEIIPHYRPGNVTPDALNAIEHPIRLKGQLFFDASHHPCTAGHSRNPKRISSWEIHPIYDIDVCGESALTECNANDESKWTPLEDWLANNQ
ncbi:MAG: hypothetical protein P8Y71_06720 [Pseudolabrys sp.]